MNQLEGHIRDVFDEIGYVAPMTYSLSFTITKHHDGSTDVWGFVHGGKHKCTLFNTIGELKHIVARKEILFRKFS